MCKFSQIRFTKYIYLVLPHWIMGIFWLSARLLSYKHFTCFLWSRNSIYFNGNKFIVGGWKKGRSREFDFLSSWQYSSCVTFMFCLKSVTLMRGVKMKLIICICWCLANSCTFSGQPFFKPHQSFWSNKVPFYVPLFLSHKR